MSHYMMSQHIGTRPPIQNRAIGKYQAVYDSTEFTTYIKYMDHFVIQFNIY